MTDKSDSAKVVTGHCVAFGIIASVQSIYTCIGTLDDVEAQMGSQIYLDVRSCMAGNCLSNKKNCLGPELAKLPIKLTVNTGFSPYYVKWESRRLARYFAGSIDGYVASLDV